ncbi:hydrolase [candidate division KSB1 bacterium]|nr:hydrolase [candidate division KSB1 bacterium]
MSGIFALDRDKIVLLIIDVQGKLARLVSDSDEFVATCMKLIKGVQILNIPVIYTEQVPEKLGGTIQEIHELLDGIPAVIKQSFSCYLNQDFVSALENSGKKTVFIGGIEAHVCVFQTARDLLMHGYDVVLIADAISSRSKFDRQIAIDLMRQAGVKIMSLEMVLFDLLQTAVGDEFRQISKLVK